MTVRGSLLATYWHIIVNFPYRYAFRQKGKNRVLWRRLLDIQRRKNSRCCLDKYKILREACLDQRACGKQDPLLSLFGVSIL